MDSARVASLISGRRRELGMTQIALAEMLGVTDKAVSRWERGQGLPDVTLMEPLARALKIDVRDLVCDEQPEQPVAPVATEPSSDGEKDLRARRILVMACVLAASVFIAAALVLSDRNGEPASAIKATTTASADPIMTTDFVEGQVEWRLDNAPESTPDLEWDALTTGGVMAVQAEAAVAIACADADVAGFSPDLVSGIRRIEVLEGGDEIRLVVSGTYANGDAGVVEAVVGGDCADPVVLELSVSRDCR